MTSPAATPYRKLGVAPWAWTAASRRRRAHGDEGDADALSRPYRALERVEILAALLFGEEAEEEEREDREEDDRLLERHQDPGELLVLERAQSPQSRSGAST